MANKIPFEQTIGILLCLCHSIRLVSYFVTLYLCDYFFWYLVRWNNEDSE